jgi:hypothetical protein
VKRDGGSLIVPKEIRSNENPLLVHSYSSEIEIGILERSGIIVHIVCRKNGRGLRSVSTVRPIILQRTNTCRGASRLTIHVPGPIATESEIDDDVVGVEMISKIALCVGKVRSRSPLYSR